MKNLITLAIAFIPALFFGQAAFDKFEQDNNFTSVTVNKKTFRMLAEVNTESADTQTQEVKAIAKRVDLFKVVATEDAISGKDLKNVTNRYIKSSGLEELMQVNDKGATFNVHVKEGKTDSQITEILVFIEETQKKSGSVLILVKGNFDMDELTELTGKVLPKATNSNIDSKLSEVKDALIFKVSPNPATGVFYINADTNAEVKLYDQSGRLVKTQQYGPQGVSVEGLAPATYLVEITTEGRRQTQHIVIK